jgi:hypothetical protein
MTRSQLTLAGTGFEKYTKMTRRAQFLAEMDRVVPWRLRDVQADTPAQPTLAALGTSGPFYGGPGSGCNLDILKVGDE